MARGKWKPYVTTWDMFDVENAVDDPDFYDNHILAEGDSWFTLGGIPTSNYLFATRFKKSTIIVNCAYPGDTIVHMSQMSRNQWFKEACTTSYTWKWNAVLLSGGGNDLIDKADEIILDMDQRAGKRAENASDYCDDILLSNLISEVQEGYRRLVSIRDRGVDTVMGSPVIAHTYDYPTPRNSPARFFGIGLRGPWLYKALIKAQVPEEDWKMLSDYLFDRLADGIVSLEKGPNKLNNFYVVDTRNTLKRANDRAILESGDWLNEIHPKYKGYEKLAMTLEKELYRHFP